VHKFNTRERTQDRGSFVCGVSVIHSTAISTNARQRVTWILEHTRMYPKASGQSR